MSCLTHSTSRNLNGYAKKAVLLLVNRVMVETKSKGESHIQVVAPAEMGVIAMGLRAHLIVRETELDGQIRITHLL